ncbi:hypothetical protein CBP36_12050 [Acidovorax carolinensis]|uniref:DUF2946 domain-containing protein n=1 Tax=Acidovorax carolinensis TaxID=553814 RepID=A0A240UDA1_9BURK|nr:hypothetical protein [Acidovorax carolinensis]ART59474.1 hypothetical protein CBP36_12050 [Acidovorax carolinensis]
MRRILSLALVVMLVLRGLMGTAMAAGVMPTVPVQAVQGAMLQMHASPAANESGHAMHAEHGGAHQATAPASCHDTPANGCSPHEHSPSCADCDICHSAMLAPPALPRQPLHLRGVVRPADSVPFASVQAARTIKPPIA